MVYYNKEILIIDFQINYAKEYTFYIDDELCHLYIKDRQGQYDYELQIDHDANTPRNLARKQKEREEWLMKFKISGASLLIILVVYFLFFMFYKKNWQLIPHEADILSNKCEKSSQIFLHFNLEKFLRSRCRHHESNHK